MNEIIKTFFIFLLQILLCSNVSYCKDNFKEIKNKLLEQEQGLKIIKKSKESLNKGISFLEDKINFLEKNIADIDLEYNELQEKIKKKKEELVTILKKIESLNKIILENNVYLIDNGHMLKIKALLFTFNYHYLLKNLDLIEYINNSFNKKLLEYSHLVDKYEMIKNDMQNEMRKLVSIKVTRINMLKNYKEELTTYRNTLANIKKNESSKESYFKSLKTKQTNLEAEIAKMHEDYTLNETSIEKAKGKLPWPIKGKLIDSKEVDNSTLYSNGIKIEPVNNGNIKAIFNGVVEYINWIKGYGSIVIINHGENYYTVYANMDKILVKEGEKIAAGKDIGKINIDEKTFKPYIYFEIRKGDHALNPLDWLKKEA